MFHLLIYQQTLYYSFIFIGYSLQAMTPKCVQHLIDTLQVPASNSLALACLSSLSEKRPQLVAPHEDAIIDTMLKNEEMAGQGGKILEHLSGLSPVSVASHSLLEFSIYLGFHHFCNVMENM